MNYLLGIDLGTTKNAMVLHDLDRPEENIVWSEEHRASAAPGTQDVEATLASVIRLIRRLTPQQRAGIAGIALTGQMHTIVMWSDHLLYPAITWQDTRVSAAGMLPELREACGLPLADGFGGTTLAYLARTGQLREVTGCCSLPDYLGRRMTGADRPVIDPSFAASWGIYDMSNDDWNRTALAALQIPEGILPALTPFAAPAGTTRSFPGLPDGIPVFAAVGDNQASILGSSEQPDREVFVTIGTGAQLSLILADPDLKIGPELGMTGLELRPFPGGRVLAVSAPLCGGRSWGVLVHLIQDVLSHFSGPALSEHQLLDQLDALASSPNLPPDNLSELTAATHFLGERDNPCRRGTIDQITLTNLTLANLARSFAAGIADSLCAPVPAGLFRDRTRMVGSGNGLRHFASVRNALTGRTGLPVELLDQREEAACGAAKLIRALHFPPESFLESC